MCFFKGTIPSPAGSVRLGISTACSLHVAEMSDHFKIEVEKPILTADQGFALLGFLFISHNQANLKV